MKIDSETEYAKYLDSKSEAELRQIADSIDRSRLKHRYEMVLARLASAKAVVHKNESFPRTIKPPGIKRGWLARSTYMILSVIVGTHGFAFMVGIIWLKEPKDPWTLLESLTPLLLLAFAILSVYTIFSDYNRLVSMFLMVLGIIFTIPLVFPFFSVLLMLRGLVPLILLTLVLLWPDLRKRLPRIFGITSIDPKEIPTNRNRAI